MAVVHMQKIEKRFQMGSVVVAALRGIDLSIEQGEMIAIMGASGSGKSTLLHIMGCLDSPTSGSYRLDGNEVARLSEDRLATIRNRHIGFVFQTYNLLPSVTALENVELPLVYRGARRRRQQALEALERVGLSRRARHRPAELSGGELQRVAIARALVTHPALVLADEPTGNLDSATGRDIMSLFQQLNRDEGITLTIVTHDPNVAAYAHRTIRLSDGLVVAEVRRQDGTVG
ncbi:MAG: ABC transporter ATP-binding protein [Chloroflexi bacterium]|nr:ABC transporter ATP-binding protein [Chloroflexota bacterium]